MKKLFCLSTVALTFAIQGIAFAQDAPSSNELVKDLCEEAHAIDANKDEVNDMVRSYMAELDNPTADQIIALSQIVVKMNQGQSLAQVCK